MDHVIVRVAENDDARSRAVSYAATTTDGELLDLDVFRHGSTFLLEAARTNTGPRNLRAWDRDLPAYLPVQQPLLLENLLFRPGLTDRDRALCIARLTEYAVSEAFRRDAGELYFLCRDASTCEYAERHHWKRIDGEQGLGLKVYRLNLLETFGDLSPR